MASDFGSADSRQPSTNVQLRSRFMSSAIEDKRRSVVLLDARQRVYEDVVEINSKAQRRAREIQQATRDAVATARNASKVLQIADSRLPDEGDASEETQYHQSIRRRRLGEELTGRGPVGINGHIGTIQLTPEERDFVAARSQDMRESIKTLQMIQTNSRLVFSDDELGGLESRPIRPRHSPASRSELEDARGRRRFVGQTSSQAVQRNMLDDTGLVEPSQSRLSALGLAANADSRASDTVPSS